MCITVSRRGTCFWDGRPCATKCEKCEKDGKAYIERVRGCDRGFKLHQTYGRFSRWPCAFFASLAAARSSLSYSSFSTQTSQGCGCIYALCLHFCFRASLLISSFFLACVTIFAILTLRQWDLLKAHTEFACLLSSAIKIMSYGSQAGC